MPARETLERFIALVEANGHAEACAQFYTVDSTMQENGSAPRVGRDAHVANERRVLARAKTVSSTCVRPVFVDGDHVVIRWIFHFEWKDDTQTRIEELAWQRWEGDLIAEETFFYDPAQMKPRPIDTRSSGVTDADDATMHIEVDDLTGPEIAELLEEHLRGMRANSPACSVHALDLDRLRQPEITFWTAWDADRLLGCGALKQIDAQSAEIKSMRTASAHLRRGVAKRMLAHIVDEAKRRGYRTLHLETGSAAAFDPARRMYESFGFAYCGPFADYVADDFSVFMKKDL